MIRKSCCTKKVRARLSETWKNNFALYQDDYVKKFNTFRPVWLFEVSHLNRRSASGCDAKAQRRRDLWRNGLVSGSGVKSRKTRQQEIGTEITKKNETLTRRDQISGDFCGEESRSVLRRELISMMKKTFIDVVSFYRLSANQHTKRLCDLRHDNAHDMIYAKLPRAWKKLFLRSLSAIRNCFRQNWTDERRKNIESISKFN